MCGTCLCNPTSGYGGPTCSQCLENCPTCAKFQDCIQCRMYSTGPKNVTCLDQCGEKDYDIGVVDAYEIKDEGIYNCLAKTQMDFILHIIFRN